MQGKTVLITGANTGIGRVTAEDLARRGAQVFLAGRSEERTRPVIEAIEAAGGKATFLPLQLDDLESVRACAKSFLAKHTSLDVLINNAGLAGARGLTKQGFELAFGTNHIGHFLLTKLLLPALRKSSAARIVNVASGSHHQAKGIDFEAAQRKTASVSGLPEYGVSKLANVLFAREFARAAISPGIPCVSLHPGVIATDVWRNVPRPFRAIMKLFMLSIEEGARTTIHCATTADLDDGAYYDKSQPKHPSRTAQDEALAAQLWRRSEEWVAPFT